MKVAVIGAGISGLVTAFRLQNRGVDVTVYESAAAAGGNIQTEIRDGFLLEFGPNTLLANRNLYDLIQDLGISSQIVAPNPSAKKRYIVRGGRLAQLPSGPAGLVSSPAFTPRGKLSLFAEPFRRGGQIDGETVYDFFKRRFGKEIADYAADPFIGGIYAGDPRKLSIEHAFPRLHALEKAHGSVVRGAIFSKKDKAAKLPKGFPRSFTFNTGVSTLTRSLCEKLAARVQLETRVLSVSKQHSGYCVTTGNGESLFDAVVVSTAADAAAKLVAGSDADLAGKLTDIYYPPIAVVVTGFRAGQLASPPSGFGVLVPSVEKRKALGVLFNSSAFDNRAPAGYHLFTTFIGGSREPELCDLPDDELVRIALKELNSLFRVTGEPVLTEVKKWKRAIPQYNVGYENILEAIDRFRGESPGIFFCSNFYKGISVGDCVKNSDRTAAAVSEFLDR